MATLIEFETTPNPDALRVSLARRLAKGPPRQFSQDDADLPLLARALFAIDGIVRILVGRDFVTVVRDGPEHDWRTLRGKVALALAELFEREEMGLGPSMAPDTPGYDEIEQQIDEVLQRWVRPLLESDGGDAVLERFDAETGTAWVRMEGACGGCPSGAITLKRSIEQAIRKWVPEVARVEAVGESGETLADPKARFRNWIAAKFGKV